MNYASFRLRILSILIDVVIILPFVHTLPLLYGISKPIAIITYVSYASMYLLFSLYLQYTYGASIGKLITKIKIVKTDGEQIGWKEVFLRNIFEIISSPIHIYVFLFALNSIDFNVFKELPIKTRSSTLFHLYPSWFNVFQNIGLIWVWSEIIVILMNKKRRALHDILAGTIVINLRAKKEAFPSQKELSKLMKQNKL